MPFDTRDFPGSVPEERASRRSSRVLVAGWLLAVNGMLLVMIALGGATRLTGSGLSIMEWHPVTGVLPPLSQAAWRHLFALYRAIPQYQLLHAGMGLAGFKALFWLEWVHRLWGRLLGVVFFIPLVWLWATGRIERRLRPRLAVVFALGGLQGLIGWFMVSSGFLPDSTAVSPYRLVIHLSLALVLYAAILWTALGVLRPHPALAQGSTRIVRWLARGLTGCVALTIVAGGFVAGTHAGLIYNTFPLMGGHLAPDDYLHLPLARNFFENPAAVQFDHRVLATVSALLALATVTVGLRTVRARPVRIAIVCLGATVAVQYVLGVATLLWVVPVPLAVAHQVNAALVLSAALATLHGLRPVRGRAVRGRVAIP